MGVARHRMGLRDFMDTVKLHITLLSAVVLLYFCDLRQWCLPSSH